MFDDELSEFMVSRGHSLLIVPDATREIPISIFTLDVTGAEEIRRFLVR